MKDIEFWFSIGSTYSYLSVARLSALEHDTGVTFSWHPFSVRKLMQEMDNIPFPPTKRLKSTTCGGILREGHKSTVSRSVYRRLIL